MKRRRKDAGRLEGATCRELVPSVALGLALVYAALATPSASAAGATSGVRFDAETNAYAGLTFTFEPRLERRVERLQFEHWLAVVREASRLLHEALNGRAHLAEVRVLIPHQWRQAEWPVLQKPGSPIMTNRRLRYADADVVVGLEGLNIQMPISFLEQHSPLAADPKLKGRLLAREFAAHRYGIFKESGFRADSAYPPFAALAGWSSPQQPRRSLLAEGARPNASSAANQQQVRGFDGRWNECAFETSPASGLPLASAANCAPYLTRAAANATDGHSFNLMSGDPFSYAERAADALGQAAPLRWADVAEAAKWHFCGENFGPASGQEGGARPRPAQWFEHNQRATNKQNKMCRERSALDVIRSSDDFRRAPFSPSTFNQLPTPEFRFLQEMPPRLVLCIEYGAHLYQSQRRNHGILEAAIAKLLAFDLIPDSEVALVLFGQQHSYVGPFRRLDGKLDPTLYSPPIDPYDEPAQLYSEAELQQLEVQAASSQAAKIVKGSCSFAKLLAEVNSSLAQRSRYDDLGADVLIVTSGLFTEDESRIEELVRSLSHKPEHMHVNLIIYPSAMLFDTKSRDNFIVLDAIESEAIVRSRINKLLLVQRLMNAQIHLVKEHLDSNTNVKMSTLLQFHQIFEHITRGFSWDQTNSMQTLAQQTVEASRAGYSAHQANGSKLSFQFEVDASIQSELLVGFIDPKHHSQEKIGKRFAIKNLQLRSPGGHVIFTDSHPWTLSNSHHNELAQEQPTAGGDPTEYQLTSASENRIAPIHIASLHGQQSAESALFPYRSQLSLAGFHLRQSHLSYLNATNQLAGVWTLTGQADELIQTSGVAMARVNSAGDTITSSCWVQTYYGEEPTSSSDLLTSDGDIKPNQLSRVKVFMQTKAGAHLGPVQEIDARLEVLDEQGNIVQNVNMLDDGLGAPDMTKGDGIYSQYVQNAYRPGFYKVNVELSSGNSQYRSPVVSQVNASSSGQDNTCCGSFMPHQRRPDTRHLSRLMYCGTFHVDSNNRLAQQRPPRVNNLTVVNVDQENRRVTIRWFEPSLDISHREAASLLSSRGNRAWSADQLAADETQHGNRGESQPIPEAMALVRKNSRGSRASESESEILDARSSSGELDFERISANQAQQMKANSIRGIVVGRTPTAQLRASEQSPLSSRYEIKLFSDRDMMKRAFDAKNEVGFKFNEWNVEGTYPNASAYGGMKEVTLRIPYGNEGIYFIGMKVYNDLGIGSHLSNIVQFYVRNNLTLEEAESFYRQQMGDVDGNMFANQLNYSLLRGSPIDGLSAVIFASIIAALVSLVVCITLVACLASSTRRSYSKRRGQAEDKKAVTSSVVTGAGSGSSMVSTSGCGSSQQSEVASSVGGSQGGHDVEINKLSLGDDLDYSTLRQQHQLQQHQAQMIQNQMISANHYQQQHYSVGNNYVEHELATGEKPSVWPQHTLVNGYAYATVNPAHHQFQSLKVDGLVADNQQGLASMEPDGSPNQNGLGVHPMSPVQSWPADILLSHYDKVKQARERNEAPPVMRIETLENQAQFSDGLPTVEDNQRGADSSYLVRQQRSSSASYFNQQLQQQLTSVLKTKQSQQWTEQPRDKSSPALDGVTELNENELATAAGVTYGNTTGPLPPPPQYIYCHEQNGLGSALVEPSIYSQVTNLQQVPSSTSGYYANQWSVANHTNASIYATAATSGSQYVPDANQMSQSNSAISEV